VDSGLRVANCQACGESLRISTDVAGNRGPYSGEEMAMSQYTPAEIMVTAAAREIRDGEIVFVGMRLPLIAFMLARQTHAPRAVGVFEAGLVRERPAPELLYTMADPPNILGATWATGLWEVMTYLQRGEVALGFIGGAEVDRHGNLNTSYAGDPAQPAVKLPGSGGAADIAALAQRFVIIMQHESRRLTERVGYVTSPGYGDGNGWRQRVGLAGGGPSALITTLGVFRFDDGDARLESYHLFSSVDEIRAATGWPLRVSPRVGPTPAPSPEELAIIRAYDPDGFWTGDPTSSRADAVRPAPRGRPPDPPPDKGHEGQA
jgi:glutaconate CoA-transferase subunit B